jgi:hypothetical protein
LWRLVLAVQQAARHVLLSRNFQRPFFVATDGLQRNRSQPIAPALDVLLNLRGELTSLGV